MSQPVLSSFAAAAAALSAGAAVILSCAAPEILPLSVAVALWSLP